MRLAGALWVILVLAGCNHPDRVPKDILPKDSMENILWDIMQADQYTQQYFAHDSLKSKLKPETIRLYQEIFELHHITREQFEKSYQFYLAHPDIARTVMDSLSSRANRVRRDAFNHPATPPHQPTPAVRGRPAIPH